MGRSRGKKGGKGKSGESAPVPKAPPTLYGPFNPWPGKSAGKGKPTTNPVEEQTRETPPPYEIDAGWVSDTELERIGPIDPVHGTLGRDEFGDPILVTTSEDSTPIADPNRQDRQWNVEPGQETFTVPPPAVPRQEFVRDPKPVPAKVERTVLDRIREQLQKDREKLHHDYELKRTDATQVLPPLKYFIPSYVFFYGQNTIPRKKI